MPLTADDLVHTLGLKPHPEGGFYNETFRSDLSLGSAAHSGPRSASTAIYFLLRHDDFSAFHRVRSDEVWHHYLGDPLELVLIDAQGSLNRLLLGSDLTNGQRPQGVAPRDVWQAARVARDPLRSAPQGALGRSSDNLPHGFTLVGCTVAPGFDFSDFELPSRAELRARFPGHVDLIDSFTR